MKKVMFFTLALSLLFAFAAIAEDHKCCSACPKTDGKDESACCCGDDCKCTGCACGKDCKCEVCKCCKDCSKKQLKKASTSNDEKATCCCGEDCKCNNCACGEDCKCEVCECCKNCAVTAVSHKAQSICPVSDEELLSKDNFVDYKGKRIFLCCPACIDKVKADPKKYMKKIIERGESLADAPKSESKTS